MSPLAVQVPRMVSFELAMNNERRLIELERRRRRGARLLSAGVAQAEVVACSISAGDSRALAPLATARLFSPCLPTTISATLDGVLNTTT